MAAEITTLTALLGSVKHATDIAKALRDAGSSLERAEMKLKMADLMESLADARISAIEIQDTIREQSKEIERLEEAFRFKEKLIRVHDAFFEIDEVGEPFGEPYCTRCWEVNHRAIHIV